MHHPHLARCSFLPDSFQSCKEMKATVLCGWKLSLKDLRSHAGLIKEVCQRVLGMCSTEFKGNWAMFVEAKKYGGGVVWVSIGFKKKRVKCKCWH